MRQQDFELEKNNDPTAVPKRVALVRRDVSLRVDAESEEMVMSAPHLVLREVIAFELLVAFLAAYSLVFDAPLEQLASPLKTPNPAKAPWYFLGLQELLHYFPPLVAGVVVPTLIVIALIVIPYFHINVRREQLWSRRDRPALLAFGLAVAGLLVLPAAFGAWSIVATSFLVSALMIACFVHPREEGWWGWFCQLSLPSWIMIWFVACATVLTLTGVYFRGPGWEFVWPWQ